MARTLEELQQVAREELEKERERGIINELKSDMRKQGFNSTEVCAGSINHQQSLGPTGPSGTPGCTGVNREITEPLNVLLEQNRDIQLSIIRIVEQLQKENNKLREQIAKYIEKYGV